MSAPNTCTTAGGVCVLGAGRDMKALLDTPFDKARRWAWVLPVASRGDTHVPAYTPCHLRAPAPYGQPSLPQPLSFVDWRACLCRCLYGQPGCANLDVLD